MTLKSLFAANQACNFHTVKTLTPFSECINTFVLLSVQFFFITHKFISSFFLTFPILFKHLNFILNTLNYTHVCKVPMESKHRIHIHIYRMSWLDWVPSSEDIFDTLHSLLCSWKNLLDILNRNCVKQINNNHDVIKLREKLKSHWQTISQQSNTLIILPLVSAMQMVGHFKLSVKTIILWRISTS